ncbi:MAG: LemA family protein [Candidatus Yanofskybacteria bacterium RIFCSPLOWO2_02_FULL_43_10]|uniref:LemA family protein n=1 Tax=Candidatus Yanofskybacteria bacterium RIFCSPLOWO2_12_FULL_43_11b TaxID=1802710 RepID=A0A1F8H8Z9_9BACT|nr:MAG: LemA family protein [Candidatus Yanofskybacteria bacterium RIFCSPHIGHO2_01_FULL_43_32]OGN11552.1 MAG: LemA family protein [Candidatus Yanofskybacteria bacterium RIFCSPHIGHO2_02_FULL_43_12]OGN17437.1 MAG: LemA family protein [Candidatus Yanofskybacteria bacterium RIFCSPHIGHO2_12_FULL_43_11]OGN24889.1 MAG: LemA family protein [Candidatus Yanofskybacteria bacterium RIFCSPLOWO2_01_FULL_43_46]OGN30261.1 MAG: LemA family protein [Candidatus Yanofskybacteria bacterium RIFCSPLOWO2_02_FULL_43_10
MNKFTWIILGVIAVLVLYSWSLYNGLVKADENITGQWAQVETQYQRRFDLIPNLINSVKGIMNQEKQIFGDLADARTRYAGAENVDDKVKAANNMESSFGRLVVVMENYPQLRSSETVLTLMAQLEGAENRISVERSRFNDAIKSFNTTIKRFPVNIFVRFYGFNERPYFESQPGTEKVPGVNF